MLKWRDYTQDDTLFEALLPEHDRDGSSALLRAVRRGHVVDERRVHLTWRPVFGPDVGDVAAMDAVLDHMITELASRPFPEDDGSYVAGPVDIDEADPYLHAALRALQEESQDAIATMDLAADDIRRLIGLPEGCALADLYTVSITPRRADGMRKAIALQRLLEAHEALRGRRTTLLDALIRGDGAMVRDELAAAGVSVPPSD